MHENAFFFHCTSLFPNYLLPDYLISGVVPRCFEIPIPRNPNILVFHSIHAHHLAVPAVPVTVMFLNDLGSLSR